MLKIQQKISKIEVNKLFLFTKVEKINLKQIMNKDATASSLNETNIDELDYKLENKQ